MSNFFWLQPVVRNTFYPSHKCFLTVSFMETLLFAVHAGVPVSLKTVLVTALLSILIS